MRRVLAAAVGAAAILSSGVVLADARTEARSHFKKGMEAISNGHYEDGIVELKRANEILPHPSVVYNIARAYAESGDLENAVSYYGQYLDGNPTDKDEVGQIVSSLEARIKRQQAAAQQAAQAASPSATPGAPSAPRPEGAPSATPTTAP